MSGSVPAVAPGTGMISPAVPFVGPDGLLLPLSYRFLFELWNSLSLAVAPSSGLTTYTGTSTTDGAGAFTATWPTAFSSAFHSFSVANNDPVFPGSGFTSVASITLSSYSGTLVHSDNLYPTPTVTVQPGVTFGWIVSGY